MPWCLGSKEGNKECQERRAGALGNTVPCVDVEVPNKNTHPGWAGAPKGMWQLLFETGWLDPDNLDKYKKDAPKEWLDTKGNIKEEYKQWCLSYLLSQRADYKAEVTQLEWVVAEQSTNRPNSVSIVFSPKYHCEIAGEGIEMCWGFLKKYYRRKFDVGQKKANFKGCLDEALGSLPPSIVRKYAGHVYSYTWAYKQIIDGNHEATFVKIEELAKQHKAHRCSLDQDYAIISGDVQTVLEGENNN